MFKQKRPETCHCKIIENGKLVEICAMHYSIMMEDSKITWACTTDFPTAIMFGVPIVMHKVYGESALKETRIERHQ